MIFEKKISRTQILFYLAYILMNLLCFFQYRLISSASFVATIGLIVIGLMIPYKKMGVYLFACLPFFNVMNMRMGSTSLYYLLMGIAVTRYILHGKHRNFQKRVVIFLSFILVTIFNMSYFKEYMQWIIRIIPLIFLIGEPIIKEHLRDIIDKYTISMLIASFWGWLMLQAGVSIYTKGYVYNVGAQSTTRFAGLVGDAVIYGGQLVLMIAFLIILIYKNKNNRFFYSLSIVLLCFLGAMSYSKSFLLCIGVEAGFVYFYWLYHHPKNIKFVITNLFLIVLIIGGISTFVYLLAYSSNIWFISLRSRLFVGDLMTGRNEVWGFYFDWLNENWTSLFKGMNLSEYMQKRSFGRITVKYTHNVFLETIVVFGIIEAIVIFTCLIGWAYSYYKKSKDILYFLPLMMLFIIGMTVHGHFEYSYYLNLLLVLSCIIWSKESYSGVFNKRKSNVDIKQRFQLKYKMR